MSYYCGHCRNPIGFKPVGRRPFCGARLSGERRIRGFRPRCRQAMEDRCECDACGFFDWKLSLKGDLFGLLVLVPISAVVFPAYFEKLSWGPFDDGAWAFIVFTLVVLFVTGCWGGCCYSLYKIYKHLRRK